MLRIREPSLETRKPQPSTTPLAAYSCTAATARRPVDISGVNRCYTARREARSATPRPAIMTPPVARIRETRVGELANHARAPEATNA